MKWAADLAGAPGGAVKAVLVVNVGAVEDVTVTTWRQAGLADARPYIAWDVWERADAPAVRGGFVTRLPAHNASLLLIRPGR